MNIERILGLILFIMLIPSIGQSQCDSIAQLCATHIPSDYISDGQSYRAFLIDEETAEFRTTFFEGTDYRIAAYSGFEPENIIFRLLDTKRNVLYSNEEYDMISFWNFATEHTGEYIVEAQLNTEKTDSGCAVILIGFSR